VGQFELSFLSRPVKMICQVGLAAPFQFFGHPLKFQSRLVQILLALFDQLTKALVFATIPGVDSRAKGNQRIVERFGCVSVSFQ
jgi:hypothetical protein